MWRERSFICIIHSMLKILNQTFFEKPTLVVARKLVGKFLMRKINGKVSVYKIIEVEAYLGEADQASHASKGRTTRTEVMFGEAARMYVYLIYGMHWMLNIVTEENSTSTEKIKISATPRIGVDYAGIWAKRKYRFVLK